MASAGLAAGDIANDAGQPLHGRLLRVLGLGFGIAAVVGGSIGSGILRTPGPVAAGIPNASLLILAWIFGGLLTLVEAMPCIELSCALTDAGGPIVYVERAFGKSVGTVIGWINWLQCILALAFMAVVFGEYLQRLGIGTALPIGVLAVGLIGVLTAINLAGTRFCGGSQALGTIVKIGGMALLVLAIALFAHSAPAAAPLPPLTWIGAVVALRLITNTYAGWNAVLFLSEEIKDPGRNIARATIIGIGIITLLLVAMNLALLHALPLAAIGASNLPAADAIATFAGPWGDRVVTIVSLVAVVTIANITLMYPSRTLYAMARSGALPPVFGFVARNGSPVTATLAATALTALLASTGAYLTLTAVYAPLAAVSMLAVVLAAIWLRQRESALARPWRMPLYPLPAIVALLVNLALLVAFVVEDPIHSLWGLGLTLPALPMLFRLSRASRT